MINQASNQIQVIKDKALHIVRNRGPLLPVQVNKELGTNVIFASALLSELVDKKVLKLSHTKIGGSPVYYVAGQEAKLQALRDKLNDKQQKAFDMLKQQKILRDAEQEPVIRASLRDIKDFAHQLQVTRGDSIEIFWKWYLTSDAEAEPLIKKKIGFSEKKQEKIKEVDVQKQLREIEDNLKKLEEKKKPIEKKRELQKSVKIKQKEPEQTVLNQVVIDEKDKLMVKVNNYFKQNNIDLLSIKQIRKNKDLECTIRIPSVVGSMSYFCKAKDKKKITDGDLSLLFVQSQMKKMPILLLTTGDITKKAQGLLNKEFKNITIKKL